MDNIKDIFNEVSELVEKKNKDYDYAFHEMFCEQGKAYAIGKLSEKFHRVKTLSYGDPQVKNESLVDSLMDIMGYCALYINEIKN